MDNPASLLWGILFGSIGRATSSTVETGRVVPMISGVADGVSYFCCQLVPDRRYRPGAHGLAVFLLKTASFARHARLKPAPRNRRRTIS
jgi:hypothetical protein